MITTNPHELVNRTTQMLAVVVPEIAEQAARAIELRLPNEASTSTVMAEINRFWRMQFAMLEMSTFSVRECLLDDQPVEGWLIDFQQYVVPFVHKHVKSLRGGK